MQRRGLVLAALTRLKQICNHPAHALRRRLDAGRSLGQAAPLRRAGHRPARRGRAGAGVHPVPRDGRAAAATPARAVRTSTCRSCTAASPRPGATGWSSAFQDGTGPPLLLVSLKAGGTGLNLTAASAGDPLRPLVEPGGRGPGHRPGVAHRPGAHRVRAQARVRGHASKSASTRSSTTSASSPTPWSAPARRGSASCRPTSCATSSCWRWTSEPAAKPFGANHPGRLPATMMKVLAAEMSDPSRLRTWQAVRQGRLGARHHHRTGCRHL